jgi:hypothetical protein
MPPVAYFFHFGRLVLSEYAQVMTILAILVWSVLGFSLTAASLSVGASLVKPKLELVINGLPIYADDQTPALLEAMQRSGLLNLGASICSGVAILCAIAQVIVSPH